MPTPTPPRTSGPLSPQSMAAVLLVTAVSLVLTLAVVLTEVAR